MKIGLVFEADGKRLNKRGTIPLSNPLKRVLYQDTSEEVWALVSGTVYFYNNSSMAKFNLGLWWRVLQLIIFKGIIMIKGEIIRVDNRLYIMWV